MIRYIKIGVVEYPFLFGQRAFYTLNQSNGIALHELGDRLTVDFDALLKVYASASKRGAEKSGRPDLVLRADEIEDIIDDSPEVSAALNAAFSDALTSRIEQFAGVEAPDNAGK
jgi:hypothetical protein